MNRTTFFDALAPTVALAVFVSGCGSDENKPNPEQTTQIQQLELAITNAQTSAAIQRQELLKQINDLLAQRQRLESQLKKKQDNGIVLAGDELLLKEFGLQQARALATAGKVAEVTSLLDKLKKRLPNAPPLSPAKVRCSSPRRNDKPDYSNKPAPKLSLLPLRAHPYPLRPCPSSSFKSKRVRRLPRPKAIK